MATGHQLCLALQGVLNIGVNERGRDQIRIHNVIHSYKFTRQLFDQVEVRVGLQLVQLVDSFVFSLGTGAGGQQVHCLPGGP